MAFDIREFLDRLESSPKKGKFMCPVCGGGSLDVNKKNGAYRCFSNECESADIRQAIAPLEEPIQPKAKRAPKKKADPVTVNVLPTLGTLPDQRRYPQRAKIRTPNWSLLKENHEFCTRTSYPYGGEFFHSVVRLDVEGDKDIRPFVNGKIGKGDHPWDAYRLYEALEFAAGNWVCVVEGEKCVEAMRFIGIPAITFSGSAWTAKDFSAAIAKLKGKVHGLLIIPDHDDAGYLKADKLTESCASHGYPCLMLNPLDIWGNMPERGDVADWIKAEKPDPSVARGLIEWAIAKAFENQHYKQKLEAAQEILKKNDPVAAEIIAETSTPLEPHRPETRRIHGGYKDLKVVELYEFVEEYLGDRLSFDDLRSEVLLDGEAMKFGHDLKFWFFHQFGESAAKEDIYSCLLYKAKMNSFNPVQKYLEQVHQGAARIDINNISSRYFGTTDPIYDRMVKMWLISAVARVYDAGCQVDHTLILQSGQGKYKSTWFKTLGGEWFSDSVKDIENKDSLLTMHSSWIIELSELDRITSKKQAGIIKHFLTQREDTFRKPYGKEVERNPRRALFCGTVNPSRFLVDSENRRFWIIPVADSIREINIPLLEKERDGIWAAAVDALHAGETWYPSDDEKAAIAELSKEFLDQDVWLEPIEEYCANKPWVSVFEILCDLFKMGKSEMDRRSEMRVAKILDHLGWTKQTRKEIYGSLRRVRLNPTWNEPEARYFADNTNTNLFNNTDGKVGNVGKSIDTQSFESYQPTDQPSFEVGKNGGRIDPTPKNEVGNAQTQTQQGIYQPTDLLIPIPEKYSHAGFEYAIGDRAYLKNSNLILEIKAYPPVGVQFMRKEYLCADSSGNEEWVKQTDLIPTKA